MHQNQNVEDIQTAVVEWAGEKDQNMLKIRPAFRDACYLIQNPTEKGYFTCIGCKKTMPNLKDTFFNKETSLLNDSSNYLFVVCLRVWLTADYYADNQQLIPVSSKSKTVF